MPKKFLHICTHSGTFHCDEAMAIAMLTQLPQYENAKIIRSRSPAIIDASDIVVDVGATYEPEKHRYDHHQRSFTETLGDCRKDLKDQAWATRTKLSSAGLVYAHFGQDVLKAMTEDETAKNCKEYQSQLYKFVYENLVEEVDAVDNGVDQYSGENLTRHYKISTTLAARVRQLMPEWNEEETEKNANDKRFPLAVEMTLAELKERVKGFTSWWAARDVVKEAVENRYSVHASGKVICLKRFCPWKKHVYLLEEDPSFVGVAPGEIFYTIFPGESGGARVQCVSVGDGSFENRKSFPEAWRGVRNKDLAVLTGCEDAIFVHASGFISGWGSMESALSAAAQAIES